MNEPDPVNVPGRRFAAWWPFTVVLTLLLGACGDSLVDHRATSLLETPGGGSRCDPGTAACTGAGGAPVCIADAPATCGPTCADCTAAFSNPSPHASPACLHAGAGGFGACGFECGAGFLRCGDTCCGATAIAAGGAHTCAITTAGGLVCWGANASGQVTRTSSSAAEPLPVEVLASGVTAVAAGAAHTCVVVGGAVECFGANGAGQATPPALSGVVALAAGRSHTCAALANGGVRCWGSNASSQTLGGAPLPAGSGVTALAAGADHTCAIAAAGAVRCWGANASGQLGGGGTGPSTVVVTASASGLPAMAHVAAGGDHTCAAPGTSNGQNLDDSLWCWGAAPGPTFSLGAPQTTPAVPLKDSAHSTIRKAVDRVAAGLTHTCVATADGTSCFGPDSGSGQLGGLPVGGPSEAVLIASIPLGVGGLAAGGDHACAIFPDGSLHCWGANGSGELGNGTTAPVAPGTIVAVGR